MSLNCRITQQHLLTYLASLITVGPTHATLLRRRATMRKLEKEQTVIQMRMKQFHHLFVSQDWIPMILELNHRCRQHLFNLQKLTSLGSPPTSYPKNPSRTSRGEPFSPRSIICASCRRFAKIRRIATSCLYRTNLRSFCVRV